MNIERLYVMFTTWSMRLPYWFIAFAIVAFFVLLTVLLLIWSKARKYKLMYRESKEKLKESQDEVLRLSLELRDKENEYIVLNKKMTAINKEFQDKKNAIKILNGDVLSLQTSISEYKKQCQNYEDEKKRLLHDLQTRKENIANLNNTLSSSMDKIQEFMTENVFLKKNLDDTQGLINRKNKQYETLEGSYNNVVSQNKILEDSKVLLENELNELKKAVTEQASMYKLEISNLAIEIEGRNKQIDHLNESLIEIKKELQIVNDEKQLLEKILQEIQDKQEEEKKEQDKYTDKSIKLIEKIAKW